LRPPHLCSLRRAARLDMSNPSDLTIDPPLRVRGRPDLVIDSLDQATAFIRPYDAKTGDPVTRGVLFRLERASNPDEAKNAADAFRWWFEQNHLMEIPEHGG
jgi:hypothetical protein